MATALEKKGAVLTSGEKTEVTRVVKERTDKRFFSDNPVEHCTMERAGKKSYEVCALSEPADADQGRRFSMAVRDPSALEKGVSLQTAKHRLIDSAEIQARPDEYLDLEWFQWFELADNRNLLFVPVVHGIPGDYDHARGSIYLFDERSQKLKKTWDSPQCESPCKGQTIQIGRSPRRNEVSVIHQWNVGGRTIEVVLVWNGTALVPNN